MKLSINSLKRILTMVFLITFDQYTKYLVSSFLTKEIIITDFLSLTLVWNDGISFGLFSSGQYSNIIFVVVATCALLYITKILVYSKKILDICGYTMVLSGGLGNLIDRIHFGAVCDFIMVHMQGWIFPIFNFADSYITLGGMLIIYGSLKKNKNQKNK